MAEFLLKDTRSEKDCMYYKMRKMLEKYELDIVKDNLLFRQGFYHQFLSEIGTRIRLYSSMGGMIRLLKNLSFNQRFFPWRLSCLAFRRIGTRRKSSSQFEVWRDMERKCFGYLRLMGIFVLFKNRNFILKNTFNLIEVKKNCI